MSIGTGFSGTDMMVHGGDSSPVVLPATCITLSGTAIGADAQVGDVVGTMLITCAYQGVPVWDMVDNANGRFAVNPSTGVVTVASALTAGDASIKVAVRLIKPLIYSPTLAITISGGTTTPDWVPANAKIHIDLVGGTPQGRAWIATSGEVAVDTLLGNDPNADYAWGSLTGYDPADLTPDGLSSQTLKPAFLGEARSRIVSAATVRYVLKQLVPDVFGTSPQFAVMSADANDAIVVKMRATDSRLVASSWSGSLSIATDSVVNMSIDAVNAVALTITSDRIDIAVSGSPAVSGVFDVTDRPPGNPLLSAVIDIGTTLYFALQSITIYDPLPTTAGLSELSAI